MATVYAMEGDRDWSNTGSFNTAIDGSGSAGLPTTGDTLIVFGETRVTAGHNGLAAVDLAAFYVQGRGNLSGTAAITLQVSDGGAGLAVISNGSGRLQIISGTAGIDTLVWNPRSGGAILSLESGTVPDLRWQNGVFEQQSAAVVTTMTKTSASRGMIYDGSTAITTLYNLAGNLECARSVTTCWNTAYLLAQGDAALATINNFGRINDRSSVAPTTLNQYAGVYSPAGSPVVRNITTINRRGGAVVTHVQGREILTAGTYNNFTGQPNTLAAESANLFSDAGGIANG